jgi:hypothetical protein
VQHGNRRITGRKYHAETRQAPGLHVYCNNRGETAATKEENNVRTHR